MIRKRVPKLLIVLATAACIFGLVLVAPAETPTLSPMPTASAEPMGNGYDATCTKANDNQVTCNISGCPRVHEQLAGESINYKINGGEQKNIGKSCGNTTTVQVNSSGPFTLSFQGCRGTGLFDTDECGNWSDLRYQPPPAAEFPKPVVKCTPPENFQAAEVPFGQQCVPKPAVKCEPAANFEAAEVPFGQQCVAKPPKKCPAGSVKPEVPPAEDCAPPTNTVTMNIGGGALQRTVTVNNTGPLGGTCAYDAKATSGLFAPGLNRQIEVGPNASTSIDVPAPPLGSTYHVTLKCTGQYDGKQVQFGQAEQDVSSF